MTDDERECTNPDCEFVGPARIADYYGAELEVCRLCGWELQSEGDSE